ncbi:MAG: hypothetical protein ACI8QC_001180 [Planctomycetota bacterium]|jgi:hypothetical protein
MTRSLLALPCLGVLVLLAAALRFPGLNYLLPLVVEPDAHISVQVRLIEEDAEHPEDSMDWAKYPLLPAYLTVMGSDPAPLPAADAPIEEHLAAASDSVLRVRYTVAWMSLLLIVGTFLLGRRFLSDPWALGAAALMATCHLAIHFGTQARPHGAAAGLSVLTVWACVLLAERASLGRYLLVTLFGALSIATLQSCASLGFAVLLAHFIGQYRATTKMHAMLLLPVLGLVLALVLAYPFIFVSASLFVQDNEVNLGGHRIMLSLMNGKGLAVLGWSLWSWDPVLAVGGALALLGACLSRLRRNAGPLASRQLWVVLAFVLPYSLVVCAYARSYERFLLPLLPFVAILIAWGGARLASRAPRLAALAFAALFLVSLSVAGRLTQLRQAPSTIAEAGAWVAETVDSDAVGRPSPVWLLRPTVLPLYKTPASDQRDEADKPMASKRQLNWSAYQRDVLGSARPGAAYDLRFMPLGGPGLWHQMTAKTLAYMHRFGGRGWAVMEVYEGGRAHPGLHNLLMGMRGFHLRRAAFSPDPESARIPHPLTYQEESNVRLYHRAWRVLWAEHFGPKLEIFELQTLPKMPPK